MMSDLPDILKRVADAGFAVFASDRDYDLNIIGLRNPDGRANQFDDLLYCIYKKTIVILRLQVIYYQILQMGVLQTPCRHMFLNHLCLC